MVIARRYLKGTNVDIRENLTLLNATLIEDVARRDEVKSAWSGEGKTIEKANMPGARYAFLFWRPCCVRCRVIITGTRSVTPYTLRL